MLPKRLIPDPLWLVSFRNINMNLPSHSGLYRDDLIVEIMSFVCICHSQISSIKRPLSCCSFSLRSSFSVDNLQRSYKKVSRREGTRVALAQVRIFTLPPARANNALSVVHWQAKRASTDLGVAHPWCTLRDGYSMFPFSRSPHERGPCVQLCLITIYRSVTSSRC